jgi:hypothetical protein
MDDPFHSSKFSIERAKDHIADLKREIQIFRDDKGSCAIVTERDADGIYDLVKLKLVKGIPRALIGHTVDSINNLRAALDQAIFAISVLGKTRPQYFPIRDTEAAFNEALGKFSKSFPGEISDIMRAAKPYRGGNNILWALHKICGANKHGVIRPLPLINSGMQISGTHRGRPAQFPFPPRWDSSKNETVLIRVPVGDGECNVNLEGSFSIAFSDVEFVDGEPVLSVLDYLADVVEGIVMTIEAEAKRIGLL